MKTTPVHVTRSTMGKFIVKPDFSVVAITSMPIASMEGRALKGKRQDRPDWTATHSSQSRQQPPIRPVAKRKPFSKALFSDRLTSSWSVLAGAKTSADGKFADAP